MRSHRNRCEGKTVERRIRLTNTCSFRTQRRHAFLVKSTCCTRRRRPTVEFGCFRWSRTSRCRSSPCQPDTAGFAVPPSQPVHFRLQSHGIIRGHNKKGKACSYWQSDWLVAHGSQGSPMSKKILRHQSSKHPIYKRTLLFGSRKADQRGGHSAGRCP